MAAPWFINALISTHTPLAGRDVADGKTLTVDGKFLLTRPLRGATSFR